MQVLVTSNKVCHVQRHLLGDRGHRVLDFIHDAIVHNAGVPRGWPGLCLTFDVTAAKLVGCVLVFRAEDKGRLSGLGSH